MNAVLKGKVILSLVDVWKIYAMGEVPAYQASKLKPVDALRYE
ncbi:MAG: hypothetical protein ABIH41_06705 [Nanoarchaeota archaeon]